MNDKMKK